MLNWVGELSEEDFEKIQYRMSDPTTVNEVEICSKTFVGSIFSDVRGCLEDYYQNKLYGKANKEKN